MKDKKDFWLKKKENISYLLKISTKRFCIEFPLFEKFKVSVVHVSDERFKYTDSILFVVVLYFSWEK